MKAYKGFDENLKCRNFQYEIGKEYEETNAKLCETGFHACENPIDVFGYYPPSNSRYCDVDLKDVTDESSDDSKKCGKRIHINEEIGIKGIVDAFIKFTLAHIPSGNHAATNTGYYSAATNTGYRSAATNSGDYSATTNSGDYSAATNSGNWSAAIVTGDESVAIATGIYGKAKGSIGCYLVIAEWKMTNGEWHIVDVKSTKVDGVKIKADTFYRLVDGKFVEVEGEEE